MMENIKTISPVPPGSEAYLISKMEKRPILFVCANDREMLRAAECLEFFAPDRKVLQFPAWDIMPYDRSPPNPQIVSQRISTMAKLAEGLSEKTIILSTVNAILQKIPSPKTFKEAALKLEKNKGVSRETILEFMAKNGYERMSKVMEPGEFAVRGSIIDVFPTGSEEGLRVDFFGEEIESIKLFDPLSQTSNTHIEDYNLLPASEIIYNEDTIEVFKTNYRNWLKAATDNDLMYESVLSKISYPGIENWLPLFYREISPLQNHLPEDMLVIYGNYCEESANDRGKQIEDYYKSRLESSPDYHPIPPDKFYEKQPFCAQLDTLKFATLEGESDINSNLRMSKKPGKNFEEISAISKQVYISCNTLGSLAHLSTLLENKGLGAEHLVSWKVGPTDEENVSRETFDNHDPKCARLVTLPIESGFETKNFVFISEQDIFGNKFIRTIKRKKHPKNLLEEASNIEINEIIVHEEHGIGKFAGLEILDVNDVKHDMIRLIYAGDDRLFVPVENIDVISRYGSSEEKIKLDRLGTANWQERTARLKERIKIAADELLSIAAKREYKKAPTLVPSNGSYEEFANSFPFTETDDQINAIDDVLEDLRKGRPMDRLICGDVGFGKTEVALRAAFVTAEQGFQVALICPTTLLARQHYKTFEDRFKDTAVTIKQLSRMVTPAEGKAVKELAKQGLADIIIGTHTLLADNMKFKNLGLVIIDEEQHFGVGQKEKLKKLRTEAHILTLSATPIPRSLQLAISGVRELSIIATPPTDRLAVRSFTSLFDEVTIREAIRRERNRGGQIFYVAPRVADLPELYEMLTKLVPEASIALAHGKMKPAELDNVMNRFYEGKYDILLSTAIVESGIDVTAAGTMIIHRADMFGLAQLYQLKGRVGRGKQRGYAYFTLPRNKTLAQNAYKRLEVIQSLDTLGAGFSLASHDMDIRGFGNLLGEEQSGHVKEVGVELYQKLLKEAVVRAKAEGEVEAEDANGFTPSINIGMSVLIPEHYIEDLDLRMGLYKRAASLLNEDEIDAFKVEITDRFGKPPSEVMGLLEIIKLKGLCKKIGIAKIDAGSRALVMQFIDKPYITTEKLLGFVELAGSRVQIKPENKLAFSLDKKETTETMLITLEEDLKILADMTENNSKKAA